MRPRNGSRARDPIKHVFIWPAVLVVLIVSIFPLVYSLTTSFLSYRLIPPTPPRFVGLDNYAALLQQARFWNVVGTTALIAFTAVALQYVIGFAVALALHARVPGERLFRVAFLLPMLLAPVAVALIARMMFNPTMGPLNELMTAVGPAQPALPHPGELGAGCDHRGRGLAVDAVRHPPDAGGAADPAGGCLRGGGAGERHALAAVQGHHLPDAPADLGGGRVHPADREP